ncbi:PI-stichotoxin-Hmg3b-like [Gastrophryne carolinensis]
MRTSIFLAIVASSLLFAVISPTQGHDCVSPAETGPCKIDITRYYYDAETKTCTKFIYGGCRGNGNNYESLEECQATCQKQG